MGGTQQSVAQEAVVNSGNSNASTAATTQTVATRVASTTTMTIAALGNNTTTKKSIVAKEELSGHHTTMLLWEQFLHLISSWIRQCVVLTKINGTQVEGILYTFTPFALNFCLDDLYRDQNITGNLFKDEIY
jgi:hypothetical protein